MNFSDLEKQTLSQKVRTLRHCFRNGLPDRLDAIGLLLVTVDAEAVDELTRQFRWLVGTASSYQYNDIAELAAEAEALCAEYEIGSALYGIVDELRFAVSEIANAPELRRPFRIRTPDLNAHSAASL